MAEYNWDELELKYFGSKYKTMSPQEKLKITVDFSPISHTATLHINEIFSKLSDKTAVNVYRHFISVEEESPKSLIAFVYAEALSALEKILNHETKKK